MKSRGERGRFSDMFCFSMNAVAGLEQTSLTLKECKGREEGRVTFPPAYLVAHAKSTTSLSVTCFDQTLIVS